MHFQLFNLYFCHVYRWIFLLAEEISLFNSNGEPVAYIDTDDENCTIYMWNGYPVAYLTTTSDDDFNIYGFNGKHLGWFCDGIVRDHEGYAVGFQKGAVSKYTQYEPYKSYKQYKPYKSYKSMHLTSLTTKVPSPANHLRCS